MKNSAMVMAVGLLTSIVLGPGPLPVRAETASLRRTADFEFAWKSIRDMYPLLTYKGIDWDRVYETYRPRFLESSEDQSDNLLCDLLRELKDVRASFRLKNGKVIHPYVPDKIYSACGNFSLDAVKNYAASGLLQACKGKVRYGVLHGNIGYVHVSTFAVPGMMTGLGEVLRAVHNTAGLVIDVRNCMGGTGENVQRMVEKFITAPMQCFQANTTKGPAVLPAYHPDPGWVPYTGPIVVLINGASVSGGEVFAMMMKKIPGRPVTLVGDTTAGAGCCAHPDAPGDVILPSGNVMFVPTTYALRNDGVPLEWNGLPPDVRVTQTQEDIARGVDLQLESALKLVQ